MQRIKSADVARLAGVSQATVSLVLNDRRDIAIPEKTRERVKRAATRLGYRPNLLARNLNRGNTQTIGLVLPRLDSSFCGRIAQGIQEACLSANYCVLVANTLHQSTVEARQVQLLLDHQVDGLIAVAEEATIKDLRNWLDGVLERRMPCVLVDTRDFSRRVDCLISDDLRGAQMAVRHLLDLRHRRIAFRSAGSATSTARDRLAGYRKALTSAGITFDARLVVGSGYHVHEEENELRQLLSLSDPPTAIFAVNDEAAARVIGSLRRLGRRVPEDVAVAGYADYAFAEHLALTTIRQDALGMGFRAAQRLLQRIENPRLPPTLITLPTQLMRRESCGGKRTSSGNALHRKSVSGCP